MFDSKRTFGVFLASLLVGTYVPLAFGQAGYLIQEGTVRTSDGTEVKLHKAFTTQNRRDVRRAIEIYREYVRQGKLDLVRPNVADPATIDIYLNNPLSPNRYTVDDQKDPAAPVGYVKPVEDFLSEKELTSEQRATLQRAVRIGHCAKFTQFGSGFAALCQKLIKGRERIPVTGVKSDIQGLKENLANVHSELTKTYSRQRFTGTGSARR